VVRANVADWSHAPTPEMLPGCYGRDATIRQMSSSHSPFWTDRSLPRLDRQDPYLSLHFVIIFVRDQERSLRFYLDQLGFRLVVDHRFESGDRWIEVAPPDGSANLALIPAKPKSKEYTLIGRDNQVFFLTKMSLQNSTNGVSAEFAFNFHRRNRLGAEYSRGLKMWTEIHLGLLVSTRCGEALKPNVAHSPRSSNPNVVSLKKWKSPNRSKKGSSRRSSLHSVRWNSRVPVSQLGRLVVITTTSSSCGLVELLWC